MAMNRRWIKIECIIILVEKSSREQVQKGVIIYLVNNYRIIRGGVQ